VQRPDAHAPAIVAHVIFPPSKFVVSLNGLGWRASHCRILSLPTLLSTDCLAAKDR